MSNFILFFVTVTLSFIARQTVTCGISSILLPTSINARGGIRQIDPVPLSFCLCSDWQLGLCYVGGKDDLCFLLLPSTVT